MSLIVSYRNVRYSGIYNYTSSSLRGRNERVVDRIKRWTNQHPIQQMSLEFLLWREIHTSSSIVDNRTLCRDRILSLWKTGLRVVYRIVFASSGNAASRCSSSWIPSMSSSKNKVSEFSGSFNQILNLPTLSSGLSLLHIPWRSWPRYSLRRYSGPIHLAIWR